MMRMHNPAHPGEVLKDLYLQPLNLSVTDAAKHLGITRKTLSQLVNAQAGVSPAMALRLAKVFNTTPDSWLNMQKNYDLWQVQQSLDLSDVRPLLVAH
jgi:antitoxin HigA-1